MSQKSESRYRRVHVVETRVLVRLLGCPKRGKNFKRWKFLPPTTKYHYLGQKHSRNVKIIKKY